jgi:hypothetical protein
VQLVFFSMEAAGLGFFVALWAASVVWTARDAQRRCGHASLRVGAPVVALLLPFAGAGLYALAKPCDDRNERTHRRLRNRMYEAILEDDDDRCGECATPLQPEFRCCPSCGERVRSACAGCGRLVSAAWAACPWCTNALAERDEAAELSEVA